MIRVGLGGPIDFGHAIVQLDQPEGPWGRLFVRCDGNRWWRVCRMGRVMIAFRWLTR